LTGRSGGWLKAADRFNRMRTEDLEAALASLRASIIESRTVSVEWLLSSRLVCVRKVEI